MKKLIVICLLVMITPLLETSAQVVVAVRPVHSKVVVVKPVKARKGHIWIAGHWKWSNRRNRYLWVEGRWVKNRPHYRYVAGRWVTVGRRGYKWRPGYWARV